MDNTGNPTRSSDIDMIGQSPVTLDCKVIRKDTTPSFNLVQAQIRQMRSQEHQI
jgi:hypothetical protein